MNGTYSNDEFTSLLDSERVRAERTGLGFSLLVLDIKGMPEYKHNIKALLFLLRKRVRCCDLIGWFDTKTIGLLLTDTEEAGARVLANNLCSGIIPEKLSVNHKIFSYPSNWIPASSDEVHFNESETSQNSEINNNVVSLNKSESVESQQKPVWKKVANMCVSIFL